MNSANFQKMFHILNKYLNVVYLKGEDGIFIQGVRDILFVDGDGLNFKSKGMIFILKGNNAPIIIRQWLIEGIVAQQHNLGFPKTYSIEDMVELILNSIQRDLEEITPVISLKNKGTYERMLNTSGRLTKEDWSDLSIGSFN